MFAMKVQRSFLLKILVLVLAPTMLFSQQKIQGRAVISGVWNGHVVKYVAGKIAVRLKTGASPAALMTLLDHYHGKIEQTFDKLGWGWLSVSDTTDIMPVISILQNNPSVQAAEPNFIGNGGIVPNDSYFNGTSPATYPYQWALLNTGQYPPGGTSGADIDAVDAWNITTGNSNVIITILDSGIPIQNGSLSHPDLSNPNRIILGPDETNSGIEDKDILGHGTHVTGIAAAETNNDTGIAGVDWNSKILVVKTLDEHDITNDQRFYNGVQYSINYLSQHNGYTMVINISSQWPNPSSVLESAISLAKTNGVTIVAIVGNTSGTVAWPSAYSSSYSNVIAVSATDLNDNFAAYSGYGPQVNVAAPGGIGWNDDDNGRHFNNLGNIYSTEPNYIFNLQYGTDCTQNYGYLAGTSMATPYVSGVVGLILSINPNLTPSEVRSVLEETADEVGQYQYNSNGWNQYLGYGRINAYKALKYTLENYGGTLSGNVTFTEDLTIASGKLLTLESGTTVNFASGTQLIVHGNMIANSSTLQSLNGGWKGIIVDQTNVPSHFYNCTIKGCTYNYNTYGLTLGGTNSVQHEVAGCYIEGKAAAVWIKDESAPLINNCYLNGIGSGNVVLSTDNSDGQIIHCKLYSTASSTVVHGHVNMNSASPFYGNNIIDGANFTSGGASVYVIGGFPGFRFGYNNIPARQMLYQYSNYSGSQQNAEYNYWGGVTPATYGPVNFLNPVSYQQNAGPNWTLSKKSNNNEAVNANDLLADTWKEYFNHNFAKSEEMAKELFQAKNTLEQSGEILFLWMKSAMHEGTLTKEENNLLSLSTDASINESARYESLRWLAKLAVQNGDFQKAEDYASSIQSASMMGREIFFDVAGEIMDKWGDIAKATKVLNKLTEKYTDNQTLREKQFVLSLYTDNQNAYFGSNNNEPKTIESNDNVVSLSETYPNPFNPTTLISYSIPNDGMVILKVYDILGREVATLVNEEKPAGTHMVNFNGENLSSGIYFYSLQINRKIYTKKMLLLK